MKSADFRQYRFDKFRADSKNHSLYFDEKLVEDVNKKSLQVLIALLEKPQQIVSHDEIIERVWDDNYHGITANHVAQYIGKLRKTLSQFQPEKTFIETSVKRGYIFAEAVTVENETADAIGSPVSAVNLNEKDLPPEISAADDARQKTISPPQKNRRRWAILLLGIILTVAVAAFAVEYFSVSDEEQIKKAVEDSQKYESLVLYKNPAAFKEELLDKYWTAESDVILNADRTRIRESVQKMIAEGRRYGDETKCEQFEFQSIEINADGDFATVRTLEKWFVAVYFGDGTLQRNKTVGPYFVNYFVRKVGGRWLIEKSTTGRMIRPRPAAASIAATSEITPGKQFFVKITGQDFEPETVSIEVTGAGCPASQPCKVPNTALREKAKMSATVLDNVPLTLAAGEFQIFVRNGDSPVSNALQITVP